MKHFLTAAMLGLFLWLPSASATPLQLHPDNPHYFLYQGKPFLFITSGEHYGAVLNQDFNYRKYLATLAHDGLNGTRLWTGTYCEPPDAFNIAQNTLAPLPGRLLCPWSRSTQPGYANGGNKFDLSKYDPAYFERLKQFLSQARKLGIIVELNLFCPFYEENMWALSPMNAVNNVNGWGAVARTNVYTLDKNGNLLAVQDALVTKLAAELRGFDNFYYEICNEPYFGGVTLDWQHHIAQTIQHAELGHSPHLISQNIANFKAALEHPDPLVSIFNFHYATPPDTVSLNSRLQKLIGENETGFRGTNDSQYRMEGWDFLAAGGGLFNNLDYSFTVGHEDGSFVFPSNQPGAGSQALRRQYGFLKRIFAGLDFIHMQPHNDIVAAQLPPNASARALVKPGQQYLVYVRTGLGDPNKSRNQSTAFTEAQLALNLNLPEGRFVAEWWDTQNGVSLRRTSFTHAGGPRSLPNPPFQEDVALIVRRR